jgi:hypothetical protein
MKLLPSILKLFVAGFGDIQSLVDLLVTHLLFSSQRYRFWLITRDIYPHLSATFYNMNMGGLVIVRKNMKSEASFAMHCGHRSSLYKANPTT